MFRIIILGIASAWCITVLLLSLISQALGLYLIALIFTLLAIWTIQKEIKYYFILRHPERRNPGP